MNNKATDSQADITNGELERILKTNDALTQELSKHKHSKGKRAASKDPKRFRISGLQVHGVGIDSEPTRSEILKDSTSADWEDLVVSLQDKDGSKFEVARVSVQQSGLRGEFTYVATLVCARSWGTEEDDDSVSCPICLFQGHGAGACKSRE